MKSIRHLSAVLFLAGLAVALSLFAPATAFAQSNLQKAIDNHINKIREDAVENKEARKVVFGDVDGNGKRDAVVQYLLEGAGGGNSWGQSLAVFLNKKGVYYASGDEVVGGKFFRVFKLQKISGEKIIGESEICPGDEPQGLCENPERKQVSYIFLKGQLQEK